MKASTLSDKNNLMYFGLGILAGALLIILVMMIRNYAETGSASLFRSNRAANLNNPVIEQSIGTPGMKNAIGTPGMKNIGTPGMKNIGTPGM